MENIDPTEPVSPEVLEELEDLQEEQAEEQTENQIETSQNMQKALGTFMGESEADKYGQHAFIRDSVFGMTDTVRATFLSESEKGRPLFSVIFLSDLADMSRFYLNPICIELNAENKLASYFDAKIQNITDAGMSNKGFIQNLNATRRVLSEKKRVKPKVEPEK